MEPTKIDWTIADQSVKPPVLRCQRCGETIPLQYPEGWILADAYIARLEGFSLMHSKCQRPEKNG